MMRASPRSGIGFLQFFNLAFGSIIGIAWLVMIGEWLGLAGPLGAIIGMTLGAFMMLLIGLCYAELATALPVAGGEVVYAYVISGPRLAFTIGWYLSLIYIAVCTFEAISLAWLLEVLVPGIEGPVLYTIFDRELTLGSVSIGWGATLLLVCINYRGVRFAARFQDILTYLLMLAAVMFVIASIINGDFENAEPLFRMEEEQIAWSGVLWVFVTTPFWYSGFQVIPQMMEERSDSTPLSLVGHVVLLAIAMAAVFYVLVILASSVATPWQTLLDKKLPVAAALEAAFDNPMLPKLVLVAGIIGILTTWNAVIMIASRLLLALGRAQMLPNTFARTHPNFHSPSASLVTVGAISGLAVLLGRDVLLPIVNIGTSCFAFAFMVCCWGVIKLRREMPNTNRPYRVPGGAITAGIALIIATLILVYTLYEPFASAIHVPLEWLVLITWGAIGTIFWHSSAGMRNSISEEEQRRNLTHNIHPDSGHEE